MMAMSNFQQLGASLTGNIETAVLVIHDYRNLAAETPELGNAAISALLQVEAKDPQLILATKSAMAGDAASDPTFEESITKIMRVQFNPASIRLNTSAIITYKKDASGNRTETVASEPPTMTMSTKLIFNDMHNFDSFSGEKAAAAMTPVGILKLASYAIESKLMTWSVQEEVEALIGALRNSNTRFISFHWADFMFIGRLSAVQANYTMFSTSGRPTRAEVSLRLQHEQTSSFLERWMEDYESIFEGDSSASLVRRGQGFGNVLNFVL